MGLDHQRHLAEKFNVQSQLFNQVAGVSDSPVLDVHEALPAELLHTEKGTEYIKATIEYINDTIPAVVENVLKPNHR
jgi:protein-tyrosine phosphatase